MSLGAGQTLSYYEILGTLGTGAMGEVYRARDTRLEREVAIKVIPEQMIDEERLLRFEREAKALASVNHANIAAIYGIDRVGSISFLALELVPGRDLAAVLAKGPLPIEQAIDVCRQIAEGLEAAHEAGVVHRDVKPANVRVTPDGIVKILDFGLAKPTLRAVDATAHTGADTADLSQEGLVLGTPTYMSPEQARGKAVDRRTDVWAFGCVLFECLTGKRAFEGDGITEILAAVFEHEWDRGALPIATPAYVRQLLERCLDKDPRHRLRDIGEARVALERQAHGDREEPAASPPWRSLPVAVTLLLGLAGGVFAAWTWFRPATSAAARGIELRRLTEFAGTMEGSPAVSPDGKVLAFVAPIDGLNQIWWRLMAPGGAPAPLTTGPFEHSHPRWVDDNKLIYFRHPEKEGEPGSLWESLYAGSNRPRRICAAQGEADFAHTRERIAMFDLDNSTLVVLDRFGKSIEEPRPLVPEPSDQTLGNAEIWQGFSSPRWSHDDRSVAFLVRVDLSRTDLRVMDLADGTTHVIASASAMRGLAWLPDDSGFVFASSAGSTMAYPPEFRLRMVRIADRHEQALSLASAGYASYVEPDITPDGVLVASRVAQDSDIYRFPIDRTPRENVQNALRITFQKGLVQVPSVSPDDDEVAYLSDSGGRANIWIARTDGTGITRQLTNEQDPLTVIGLPLWSPAPGGDLIAYYKQNIEGAAGQWLISPDGFEPRWLADTGGGACWSHDGKWLYSIVSTGAGREAATGKIDIATGETVPVRSDALGLVVSSDGSTAYFLPPTGGAGEVFKASPIETGEPELLIGGLQSRVPLWPHHYTLSPDDKWLATPLRDRGTTNLFLISTTDGAIHPITDFGDRSTMIARQVSWSSDSRFVFAALMETDADIVLLDVTLAAK